VADFVRSRARDYQRDQGDGKGEPPSSGTMSFHSHTRRTINEPRFCFGRKAAVRSGA
jgi:hypothetical protein